MFKRVLALLALGALSLPAAAGTIKEVTVIPNPATITATNQPALVNVTVHVAPGSILFASCEAIIDPGDGTQVPRLVFSRDTSSTQTAHLRYTKPGTYKVRVYAYGSNGCEGGRDISITVRQAGAPGDAQSAANSGPVMPACPAGWSPAPNAVKGARLACRVDPVPIACPQGTTYFNQGGVIGCR